MAALQQNVAYTRAFLMVQSADHLTGAGGLTVTATITANNF
jgi:hypothetical protein